MFDATQLNEFGSIEIEHEQTIVRKHRLGAFPRVKRLFDLVLSLLLLPVLILAAVGLLQLLVGRVQIGRRTHHGTEKTP